MVGGKKRRLKKYATKPRRAFSKIGSRGRSSAAYRKVRDKTRARGCSTNMRVIIGVVALFSFLL